MQMALTRDDYQNRRNQAALRELARQIDAHAAAAPVRVDVCRLVLALFGLSLYVGAPIVILGYLGSRLLG